MSICHISFVSKNSSLVTLESYIRQVSIHHWVRSIFVLPDQHVVTAAQIVLSRFPSDIATRTQIVAQGDPNASGLFKQILTQVKEDVLVLSTAEVDFPSDAYEILARACMENLDSYFFPMRKDANGPMSVNPVGSPMLAFSRNLAQQLGGLLPADQEHLVDTVNLELSKFANARLLFSLQTTPMATQDSGPNARKYQYFGKAPRLSIVIPTLDASSSNMKNLLASLAKYTDIPFQAIVTDNGNSTQGYATPVNTAIRACKTEYVAIINDDVQVFPKWWQPLQKALDEGEKLVFPTTIELTRPDFSAWCFAMSAESLKEISFDHESFFDPALVIYFQDSDLLLRMRKMGNPPKHVPSSFISHKFSATVGQSEPEIASWIAETVKQDEGLFVQRWGASSLSDVGYASNTH